MNCDGRKVSHVGRKLLPTKPLQYQRVAPSDSVLGSIADSGKGLTVIYRDLVEDSFHDKWWKGTKKVDGTVIWMVIHPH